MDERKVIYVKVCYHDGTEEGWPDPAQAAAEVYGISVHALGNAITKLQYAAITPEEAGRITHQFLLEAVSAVTGAEEAVVEEWLEMLRDATRRFPAGGITAPV